MSADSVAPMPYHGFTFPSWATPCDSEQLCEVDGLPIIATMQARVSPIAPRGKRPNSKSHEFKLCAICLLWEMRNRGELSYEDAHRLTEQLREEAVPVKVRATHANKAYKSKHKKGCKKRSCVL